MRYAYATGCGATASPHDALSPMARAFVMPGGAMATPVQCTACSAVLEVHCASRQCHWYRCDNRACIWRVYDLHHGVRSTLNGTVERLGAPPEAEAS